MKKILVLILSIIMLFQSSAFADINIEVKNAMNDELKIYGNAADGQNVVLFIMDVADSAESIASTSAGELINNNKDKVLYASSVEASNGNYTFDFLLSGVSGSDTYKAIVTVGNDTKQVKEFSFYPNGTKQSFISSISTGDISAADITNAISYFSLSDYLPSQNTNAAHTGIILKNLRDKLGGFPETGLDYDTDEFIKIIKKAFVISALNNNNQLLFNSSNRFLYAEDMEITALPEYMDYTSSLNTDGINFVRSSLLNANITDSDQFISKFKSLIHLNVLINYKDFGNSHVPGYLTKYDSAYRDTNLNPAFNLDGLSGCTWLTTVYGKVADSKAAALSVLAAEFNTAVATDPNQDSGVTDTSPGQFDSPGNGGGMGGGLGYVQPQIPVTSASSFKDVPADSWAYEYIDVLVKAGILNGKGDGVFAPDDNVKRGEYAKMIALAAGLTPDSSKCTFPDTKNLWSSPYVGAAVEAGFISGINENEFAPENDITREQAAVIIGRALNLEQTEPFEKFSDDSSISDWARGYVYALKDLGILSGRGNNMFCPNETLTRAESAKLISIVMERLQK